MLSPTHPPPGPARPRRGRRDPRRPRRAAPREGHGGALTVVGEPGIGKTAVLANAVELIATDVPGARIIRIAGVEAELEMAWSGLAALLDGLLGGLANLAPARAAAVRSALAIDDRRRAGRTVRHRPRHA